MRQTLAQKSFAHYVGKIDSSSPSFPIYSIKLVTHDWTLSSVLLATTFCLSTTKAGGQNVASVGII